MKIFRPLKSNWKTQGFGESKACCKTDIKGRIIFPTTIIGKWKNICPSGFRDFYKAIGLKSHNGEDWSCWTGEPIYFPVDANCEWWARNEIDSDSGKGLDVFSDRPIPIGDLPIECGKSAQESFEQHEGAVWVKFRFWHLSKSLIQDDGKIKLGDLIALGGNSGASSNSHLHWSLKIVDQDSRTLDKSNGWYGATDFSKYYENVFVGDIVRVKKQALNAIDLAIKVIFLARQYIQKMVK